ncbi:unnamed protein product, partial [Ectocarpus sp. 12 AP-2014]
MPFLKRVQLRFRLRSLSLRLTFRCAILSIGWTLRAFGMLGSCSPRNTCSCFIFSNVSSATATLIRPRTLSSIKFSLSVCLPQNTLDPLCFWNARFVLAENSMFIFYFLWSLRQQSRH